MLRLYESAASKNFRHKTVRDLGLQPRSMTFVKDVRQQLMEIMQKEISSLSRVKNPGSADQSEACHPSPFPPNSNVLCISKLVTNEPTDARQGKRPRNEHRHASTREEQGI